MGSRATLAVTILAAQNRGDVRRIPHPESMDMDDTVSTKLTKLVNASGFPYQLALEDAVRSSALTDQWQVTGREHPWRTTRESGYIDLVLSNGTTHLVIECKRSRDAVWLFLMPDSDQLSRSHARICWTDTKPHQRALLGWGDIQVHPVSPESEFCAIRGQGEKGTPLLERLASSVVESSEGLASHLLEIDRQSQRSNVIVPVIVTSAALFVSQFALQDLDLQTGELDSAEHVKVSHVRFRKSLSGAEVPLEYEPETLGDLADGSIRTVFVVEGSAFVEWLGEFQTSAPDSTSPWVSARSVADAIG